MKFAKWHGLGNDFIIVNVDEIDENINLQSIARKICDRHFGIGADGLVPIKKIDDQTFQMVIYTSDGKETEMCGNASRCVASYIYNYKLSPFDHFALQTRGGIVKPQILDNNQVQVNMGKPRINHSNLTLQGFQGCDISMGNPHFVAFVDDMNKINLEIDGRNLENDPHFPNKSNIEFLQVLNRDTVRMRVWERGCGVTLACGTGSSASCVAGVLHDKINRKIQVILDGGELQIEWSEEDNHVYMTGPAEEVFVGDYFI